MAKGKKEYSFKKCTVNVDEDQIIEYKNDGIHIHSLSKGTTSLSLFKVKSIGSVLLSISLKYLDNE